MYIGGLQGISIYYVLDMLAYEAYLLQGCSKALSRVILGGKVPPAARKTQFYHLIFTQPGARLLVNPRNLPYTIDFG